HLGAECLAEAFPDRAAGGRDIDVTVGGLEHTGRDRSRVIVAGLLGDLLLDQPARGLEVEHEYLRLQQRRRNVLALLRNLALMQRGENSERAEKTGREVGHWNADTHRALPRQ